MKKIQSNAVFDPHTLAEEKKVMQESQNLTIEGARQKLLDIFVKQKSPRHHILYYTEQFTNGTEMKKDESFYTVKALLD